MRTTSTSSPKASIRSSRGSAARTAGCTGPYHGHQSRRHVRAPEHRELVVQTDMNLLSVLQYATDVLKVNHLIVCGHYGCGGLKAALSDAHHGSIDNWLRTVKDTQQYFRAELAALDEHARFDRTVELNVIEFVYNLGKANIVRRRGETAEGRICTAGGRPASRIHPPSDERDQQRRGGSNQLQSPQRHGEQPALIDSAPIPLSARARAACGEHSGWTCEQNAANVANLDG